jgi:hypothetical protein
MSWIADIAVPKKDVRLEKWGESTTTFAAQLIMPGTAPSDACEFAAWLLEGGDRGFEATWNYHNDKLNEECFPHPGPPLGHPERTTATGWSQVRNLVSQVVPEELSQADHANHVAWRGTVIIKFVYRSAAVRGVASPPIVEGGQFEDGQVYTEGNVTDGHFNLERPTAAELIAYCGNNYLPIGLAVPGVVRATEHAQQ